MWEERYMYVGNNRKVIMKHNLKHSYFLKVT